MESLAATWAAQRITPEGAAALRRQVAKFTKPQPESSNYAEIDFELHEMIWELAGNLRLAQTLDRIAGPMIALQARVYGPLLPDLVRKEAEAREGSHTRIVEAICAGNAAKARTAVQRHVLDFWRIWLKQSSADAAAIQESREAINEAIDLLEPLAAIFEPVAKKHRAM
jgi:DNA-binding FadR family transcriptional regulator